MHSSITVGVRANIIPFKMIRTLNSTQQSPRTARDLLHFLSRPYPASFAFNRTARDLLHLSRPYPASFSFNLVLFRFFLLNKLLIPSISLAATYTFSSSFGFPPPFTCHVNLTLINMRFYHVLLLLPISQTHIDFLDLSISQNFWRSHHVRVVVVIPTPTWFPVS